jgi:hypothetical protein
MGCGAPHPLHWADLRACSPKTILQKPGVVPTGDGEIIELSFLDVRYRVNPGEQTIKEIASNPNSIPSQGLQILLLRYLSTEHNGKVSGEEVTEKELPGGPTFFRGPHELQLAPVIERYGRDPGGLISRGLSLGATKVEHGDAGLRFLPFPEVPVTYLLWKADDEFPATVTVVFDKSITEWFELDMIFILVQQLSLRIAADPA